jgi:hypothetical protein
VGNVLLYKLLFFLLDTSTGARNERDLEEALWKALDLALKTDENSNPVVDELDQINDSDAAKLKFLDRLHSTCVHHAIVKSIVLTKSLGKLFSKSARQLFIQPKYIYHDLFVFVGQLLASHSHFRDCKEEERRDIIHRIIDGVKNSFVLTDLIVQLLLREETHEGLTRASNNLSKSVADAVQRWTSQLDLTITGIKLVLSWLLVVKRSLTLQEIQFLLKTETITIQYKGIGIHVKELIRRTCKSLLQVRDEIVNFRHLAIRHYLKDRFKAGKTLFRSEEAHRELTYRCLTYTNTLITSKTQCTLNVLDTIKLEVLFQTNHLLKYTTRYWIRHFCASLMYCHLQKGLRFQIFALVIWNF